MPLTSEQRSARVAAVCGALATIVGLLVVVGRIIGVTLFPHYPPAAPPTASWVATVMVLLGPSIAAVALWPERRVARYAALGAGVVMLVASLVAVGAMLSGSSFDIEHMWPIELYALPASFGRSSVVGAPALVLASTGLILLALGRRRFVGVLGVGPALLGVSVCVAFLYHVPLVLGEWWRPIALTGALAATLSGTGLIAAAGPSQWPLRVVTGSSVQPMLFRWFMPFTTVMVLLSGIAAKDLFASTQPALGAVLSVLISVTGGALVVYYLARIIGGRLDRAEAQLVASERQFRSLIESSSDVVTITDPAGAIRYQSPSIKSLLGFESGERAGANMRDLVHPDDVSLVTEAFAAALGPKGAAGPITCRVRHKSGTWRMMEVVLWNMVSAPGVGGIVMHSRDVTDRQALEAQLRQAQKMEAVGQLAGGIAHDFNNILSVIMANAGLLDPALPADASAKAEELRDLQGAAERGKAMIRQIMGISRAEGLSVKPVDLGQLAKRVAVVLRRILPAHVTVEASDGPGLPPALADAGATEQMLLNLATNARDAMPKGGTLRLVVERTEAQPGMSGEFVSVAAVDTGTGMDEPTLKRVFEPFFTTKIKGAGTGLGLSMVRDLMTQHGGFVRITSEVGKGTSVRLCFPASTAAVTDAGPAKPEVAKSRRGTETVLVVDDDEMLRRAARRVLELNGYRVIVAEDGEAAMRTMQESYGLVDLVFTDMMMPRMGGGELHQRVTSELGPKKFLIASGHARTEAQGADGLPPNVPFIAKPWTLDELLDAVRSALDAPGLPRPH